MSATALTSAHPTRRVHLAVWSIQVVLFIAFALTGLTKLTSPLAALEQQMLWVQSVPEPLIRFIGAAELAGALGLVLPSLTRILPRLTVLAAIGLVLVMALAAVFHVARGEHPMVVSNLLLGSLAAAVAWGRAVVAPIPPRG